jgi:hypothetical protein
MRAREKDELPISVTKKKQRQRKFAALHSESVESSMERSNARARPRHLTNIPSSVGAPPHKYASDMLTHSSAVFFYSKKIKEFLEKNSKHFYIS